MKRSWIVLGLILAAAAGSAAQAQVLRTDDLDRFVALLRRPTPPTASDLQAGYLDRASPALARFADLRALDATGLDEALRTRPDDYRRLEACASQSVALGSRVEALVAEARRRLPDLGPVSVHLVVGAGSSGGSVGRGTVVIGMEVACRPAPHFGRTHIEDHLLVLIAHELAHVYQLQVAEDQPTTVLFQSLVEGTAELFAEVLTGEVLNTHLSTWTRGRERAIATEFSLSLESKDLDPWLYNGLGDTERPGDLGYWVGWRIGSVNLTPLPSSD